MGAVTCGLLAPDRDTNLRNQWFQRLLHWRESVARTFPSNYTKCLVIPALREFNRRVGERKAQWEQDMMKAAEEHRELREQSVRTHDQPNGSPLLPPERRSLQFIRNPKDGTAVAITPEAR